MATAPLATVRAVSPLTEMGAYEALWANPDASFASLAEKFREEPELLPSEFVKDYEAKYFSDLVLEMLRRSGVSQFGIRVHRAGEYPTKLRDAEDPVELMYYRGWWNLVETRSVAVVGTRAPSTQGIENATRLVGLLVVAAKKEHADILEDHLPERNLRRGIVRGIARDRSAQLKEIDIGFDIGPKTSRESLAR
ncbi:MAG TPA: DNA-processing protein DprA [Candidatus Acidoferrales bacterium]|nr:DNA-processing protein DprA [Candidatus Acidoferrales bacterium]